MTTPTKTVRQIIDEGEKLRALADHEQKTASPSAVWPATINWHAWARQHAGTLLDALAQAFDEHPEPEPVDEAWPFRYVTIFCDKCGIERSADVRADTKEQAFAGLRATLNTEEGWLCTERGDWCDDCAGPQEITMVAPAANHQALAAAKEITS